MERCAVTARAGANIALVKYWGKRDPGLNLPAAGSLSLTLDSLVTDTRVEFVAQAESDELVLNGQPAPQKTVLRLSRWLDIVRERARINMRARVKSDNSFPTASGLASSASAYAALALAATRAAGLELSPTLLSVLARRGSGSAARSMFGGLVELGPEGDAQQIDACETWPLRMAVAVIGGGVAKSLGSTEAMEHTRKTSPMYEAWLASVPGDLRDARRAIRDRDLAALGQVAERSALTMHASALAARPTICYFQPGTIACMSAVTAMRAAGLPAYFTIDAGPHVKVLTLEDAAGEVVRRLEGVAGVDRVILAKPGPGAKVIS